MNGSPYNFYPLGHTFTHVLLPLYPNDRLGHVLTHLFVVLSAKYPNGHFLTHLPVVGSPYVFAAEGTVTLGHLPTHDRVSGSANCNEFVQ